MISTINILIIIIIINFIKKKKKKFELKHGFGGQMSVTYQVVGQRCSPFCVVYYQSFLQIIQNSFKFMLILIRKYINFVTIKN